MQVGAVIGHIASRDRDNGAHQPAAHRMSPFGANERPANSTPAITGIPDTKGAMLATLHERAAEAGRIKDRAWFRCNPGRCYRIRKSLPFECHDWGPHDHKEFKFMAVHASRDGTDYRRHALKAGMRPGKSEEFVRRVFERIDKFEGKGLISVSSNDHEADLRLAGDI